MVIAAAGALSVATAASAAAATWNQGPQAHPEPEALAPEALAQKAMTPEEMTPEEMTQKAVVAPRLTVTDQIAGPIAATAAGQRNATWAQRAYLVRLTAVQDAIAQRKAATLATKAAAATAASGSPQQIAQAMLGSFGWSSSQFSCLDPLWAHESGWSVSAYNAGSGAFGIPQALPGSRMASAGPDWQTNAATQIKWGLDYIKGTYGSPCGAWSHEEATGWY